MPSKALVIDCCDDCKHVVDYIAFSKCGKEGKVLPRKTKRVGYTLVTCIPMWCTLEDTPVGPLLPAE